MLGFLLGPEFGGWITTLSILNVSLTVSRLKSCGYLIVSFSIFLSALRCLLSSLFSKEQELQISSIKNK